MGIHITDLIVEFRLPGHDPVKVLDIPSFSVADAQQVCLVGRSGGGKTTLLNVISGIVLPTAGRVEIDGTTITALDEAARDRFRARSVGYVFQTFNLLQGLTALENVQIAQHFAGKKGKEARQDAVALLERIGLGHRLNARPGTLSVGEQQRVALARAVVNRPPVVLADEPTANLDEENGEEVLALLQEVVKERNSLLVLVTHEPQVVARFETVLPLAELGR